MIEYKDTLNLPKTDFPMKANLAKREPEILKDWEKIDIFKKISEQNRGKKKFILHLGPPYANGHIHLGTATTTVLKDIIVKSKLMSGYDSPLVPGWDCHGLPTELNVEKKIGKPGVKVSAEEFRKACREYAASFMNIQREEFKRLGIIADWKNPYLTMDPKYEANIVRSLAKLVANGYLMRGSKPVHWCLECASALAEAEVEYAEKTSTAIDVRFRVVSEDDFVALFNAIDEGQGPISIPIWTTTIWTLPANEAVTLNAQLVYVCVECDGKERLLIAKDLLSQVMSRYKIENYRVLGEITGNKLVGIKLKHPFYAKEVPVIVGEHVTVETGTGAVHTSPAHGYDDYIVGKQFNLPIFNPIGDDGCFLPNIPIVGGLYVRKTEDVILNELKAHNSLIHQATIKHSYPMCWRHKTPLIFLATPQWFINMDESGLRKAALNAVKEVTWIPAWGESRIYGMIEMRPDWCISRQRTWGVPLSLLVHKETGELHPNMVAIMEEVAKRIDTQGIDAWYQLDLKDVLQEDADKYKKVMDVLDVWFDSGVSHECVLKQRPELAFPADIILEGSDQHRGWFQSSLLTSTAMNGYSAYKSVLTHGFVVDGEGRKMSKSLGNVIAPHEIVNTLGADVLRLWVASVDYRYEINASREILNRASETYRRIRNTARFLLANMHDFDPKTNMVKTDDMLMLDRFILHKAHLIQAEIVQHYHEYQFHLVIQKLHQFCLSDLGAFYLDIIKDRQYTMAKDSRGRRSAQTALFHIAQALLRWMAPIMSFTAEEIWKYIPKKDNEEGEETVFLKTWYDKLPILPDSVIFNEKYWENIRAVSESVNKEIENERNAGHVGSSLEAEVYLYCSSQLQKTLELLGDELRFVLLTSYAKVVSDHAGPEPADRVKTDVPGLAVKVKATKAPKCERCWQRRYDVDFHKEYHGICKRCVENIAGAGEVRMYA